MHYTVLFDFRHNWGWYWLAGLFALGFIVSGIALAISRIRNHDGYPMYEWVKYIGFAIVSAIIFGIFVDSQVHDQTHERRAFANGAYNVVEGYVLNYTGTSEGREKTVWFDVGREHFEVSCCWASMRFHQTPYEGGEQIIRNGEWLRIIFLSPEEILRIEKRD